jgi:hypothetical protein
MTSVFPSAFFHVGGDETWELGQGRTAGQVQQEGASKVYAENLKQVAGLLKPYSKRVIFRGDMALQHPEIIKDLPKGLIVASWDYSQQPNYERSIKPYVEAGFRVIVCPWIANTNQITPNFEEAAANIAQFTAVGKKAGALGVYNTVWNDHGGTLYGANWWGIVYGPACAGEVPTPSIEDFDRKFDWAFYRNTDHRFVAAHEKLRRLNVMLSTLGPGEIDWQQEQLFWQDPFSPQGREELRRRRPVEGYGKVWL